MNNSSIEEIKNRLDIVDVIGSYLKLQKTGINYRAVCPFHSEKKPSFFVSPTRQSWRCFGCGKGGDIFGFIKEIEGIEFGDALKILAQKAGVELKSQPQEMKTERKRLYEICDLASLFFEKQLEGSKIGSLAKEYLLSRGLSSESIKKWRLGYSPDSWHSLCDFLVSRGYKREEVERAGLAIRSSKGYYDRFRGRIMFPVFDFNSQVIGFGGRVFDYKGKKPATKEENLAKYVNTPATILYDKSRTLYGLNFSRLAIRKKDSCILLEGYVDVIMSAQTGIENIVAVSGTALTPLQLKTIKRYTENLIISFDMDLGGNIATKRSIELAQEEGFNIKVVTMPDEMDPADVIVKNEKEWPILVEAAESIMDFYFEIAFKSFDPQTIDGKKKIASEILPAIKAIPNKIEKSFWLKELSKKLQVEEGDLKEEMDKLKTEKREEVKEEKEVFSKKNRQEMLEERILSLVLKAPERVAIIGTEDFSERTVRFFKLIQKKGKELKLEDFEEEMKEFANLIFMASEIEEMDAITLERELQFCVKEFKILVTKNKLDFFSSSLKKAEIEKNEQKTAEALKELNFYSNILRDLEKD